MLSVCPVFAVAEKICQRHPSVWEEFLQDPERFIAGERNSKYTCTDKATVSTHDRLDTPKIKIVL